MDTSQLLAFASHLSLPLAGFLSKFLDEIVDEDYPIPDFIAIGVILLLGMYCGIAGFIDDIIAIIFLAFIIGLILARKVDDWRIGLSAVIIAGIIIFGRVLSQRILFSPSMLILGFLITLGIILDEVIHDYAERSLDNRFQLLKMRPIIKIQPLIFIFLFPQFTLFYALDIWLFDLTYELTRILMQRRLMHTSKPIPLISGIYQPK
ncbi:MAG: hypothetical protein ACFFBD_12105 [Candidatus Hodarchaeota archaeon]